jgi:Cu(I)/Ag(I) efflux system periplasmic protein CusF
MRPNAWLATALLACSSAVLAAGPLAEGEIRKVDKNAKKITIKHGEIKSIDMPPMTMVFQVKDAALLEKVKAGDKVKFAAEKQGSAYVVTSIEAKR